MNSPQTSNPKIAILLSVYNGESFLGEQLDSLLSQSYQNFIVVVRDDGSTDGSYELIRKYAESNPTKFHVLPPDGDNKGASGGFAFLMEYALKNKAELGMDKAYLMFCDQDDVWSDTKVKIQIEAMLATEKSVNDSSKPVLIHSDLQVVAADISLIAPSFVSYQGLEIERNRFPNLVISNLVTGCTALLNEPLAVQALPIPANAIMHDWWLAVVAAAFGEIVFLDQALLNYRQHENNTIGASKYEPEKTSVLTRVFSRKPNEHLIEVGVQAKEFRTQFGKQLSLKDNVLLVLCSLMRIEVGMIQRVFYRLARRF